jgi:hypothetical protein
MLVLVSGIEEAGVYYRNRCEHFKIAVSSGSSCCYDPLLDGRLYWGTRPSLYVNVMLSIQRPERLALMCSVTSENDKIMGYVGWIQLSDPKTRFWCPIHPCEPDVDKEQLYLTRNTYLRGDLIEHLL